MPKQVILVQVRHITRRNNRHNSMTHDTYDTCFYKCYTRARRERDKYILKRKYNKRKSYKNRCHKCHVSRFINIKVKVTCTTLEKVEWICTVSLRLVE